MGKVARGPLQLPMQTDLATARHATPREFLLQNRSPSGHQDHVCQISCNLVQQAIRTELLQSLWARSARLSRGTLRGFFGGCAAPAWQRRADATHAWRNKPKTQFGLGDARIVKMTLSMTALVKPVLSSQRVSLRLTSTSRATTCQCHCQ